MKVYVDRSPIQGRGVFAAVDIARGEAILAIDDSRIVTPQRPLHPQAGEYDFYRSYLAERTVVLMQYPERHINHCCDPNSFIKTVIETRYVFALRDVAAGEEITYDYSINGSGAAVWKCSCGSAGCRHTIYSDFFRLPEALQMEYLPLLDDWFVRAYRLQVEALLRRSLER
jgi:SET domain-containing protein